jgi:hypothetical protein
MRAPPPNVAAVVGADGADDGIGAAGRELVRHVAELRQRLRPVCRDWDESDFEALVRQIAHTKMRWAERGP